MKIQTVFIALILFSIGCDPISDMEATIKNSTSQNLTIDFISSDKSLAKILKIDIDEFVIFEEGFDVGGSLLEPSLIMYDSVVIRNQSDITLKVYKQNDTGKNIYNIDEDWKSSIPSKRFYKYEYEILSEDFE